jgi:hypothetical protein
MPHPLVAVALDDEPNVVALQVRRIRAEQAA